MTPPSTIRRASHPLAQQVRRLSGAARERHRSGRFVADGPRVLTAALDAGAPLETLLVAAERFAAGDDPTIDRASSAGTEVVPVASNLLDRLSPSATSQGFVGLFRMPEDASDPARVLGVGGPARILVTWRVQDPGNLGTLIRSAAALGARGLLAIDGADPWGPKAVRGSAGALFQLPVARWVSADPSELVRALSAKGFQIVTAAAHGGAPPARIDWNARTALLLGAEVAGLPAAIADASRAVTIPLDAPSESLSVAVAGAVLLDRARRAAANPGEHP